MTNGDKLAIVIDGATAVLSCGMSLLGCCKHSRTRQFYSSAIATRAGTALILMEEAMITRKQRRNPGVYVLWTLACSAALGATGIWCVQALSDRV